MSYKYALYILSMVVAFIGGLLFGNTVVVSENLTRALLLVFAVLIFTIVFGSLKKGEKVEARNK